MVKLLCTCIFFLFLYLCILCTGTFFFIFINYLGVFGEPDHFSNASAFVKSKLLSEKEKSPFFSLAFLSFEKRLGEVQWYVL